MAITNVFQLTADIKRRNQSAPNVTVTQNDTIRFEMTVTDGGTALTTAQLAELTTTTLASTRPDGQVVVRKGRVAGSVIVFEFGNVETAVAGKVDAVVQIYTADRSRVSTISFKYEVVADPTGPTYEPLKREQTLIEAVIHDGPKVVQDAREAATYANAVAAEARTNWLEPVATVAERDTKYGAPSPGDMVRVITEATTYRFANGRWVVTDRFDSTAVDELHSRVDGVNAELAQKANATDGGLDRLKATSKFITNMSSYVSLVNTAFPDDNATRLYIEPKAPVKTGAGGTLKLFGDDYTNGSDYRDLGIYFHADQKGDKGFYGNGVFWVNGKVLESGQYNGKNPDIGFSFQDGEIIAGRITAYGGQRAMWVFGTSISTLQAIDLIAEFQKDIGIVNGKGIKLAISEDGYVSNYVSNDSENYLKKSLLKGEKTYVNGELKQTIDENKTEYEKSVYTKGNFVVSNSANGVVMKSPNGSQFMLKVGDDGTLSTVKL